MAEETRSDPGIDDTTGSAGTAVKDGLVGSLKDLDEIETGIVNLVRSTVSDALKATAEVASGAWRKSTYSSENAITRYNNGFPSPNWRGNCSAQH